MFVRVFELSRAYSSSIRAKVSSIVQLNGGKEHKKGTGESVFGLHRRERIAFVHVLLKVSWLFVFSSLAEHISAEWS